MGGWGKPSPLSAADLPRSEMLWPGKMMIDCINHQVLGGDMVDL